MEIYKKILAILICVSTIPAMLLLGGCNEKPTLEEKMDLEEKIDIEFPMDEKGYPQSDILMINNKSYPIELVGNSHTASKVDSEIQVKMDKKKDIVEVILPQYLPVNYWSIGEKEYVDLISYNRTSFPIKDKHMIEGISAEVQRFKIRVAMDEATEILLKWSNINEADKLFKDKKEDYFLKIVVSY